MIAKILNQIRRIQRARHFGVRFVRCSKFTRVPDRIQLAGREVAIASPSERGAVVDFRVCLIDDEYGLDQVTSPVATIVDIGANVGFFSLAARGRFPNAQIHSYEPNPRILTFLERNAAAAGFQVFSEAVGGKAGFVTMEDSGDSNQAKTTEATAPGKTVRQVTLATVVERLGGTVDLAKIDCEGAEWQMFEDPEPWRKITDVRMEYHLWGRHSIEDLRKAVQTIGFEIQHFHPSGEWGTIWCRNRVR